MKQRYKDFKSARLFEIDDPIASKSVSANWVLWEWVIIQSIENNSTEQMLKSISPSGLVD